MTFSFYASQLFCDFMRQFNSGQLIVTLYLLAIACYSFIRALMFIASLGFFFVEPSIDLFYWPILLIFYVGLYVNIMGGQYVQLFFGRIM